MQCWRSSRPWRVSLCGMCRCATPPVSHFITPVSSLFHGECPGYSRKVRVWWANHHHGQQGYPLHKANLSNLEMGYIFEEIIRRFSKSRNEDVGQHYTPEKSSSWWSIGNKICDRVFHSLLNSSQIMYWILMLVSVVILVISQPK